MSEPRTFDVVVIGAGPGGVSAAVTAARLGKSVAIVEKHRVVGGAALNTGTVPSKTLRETALALSGLRTRSLHGVDLSLRRECTVGDLLTHERSVRRTVRAKWNTLIDAYGVTVVIGTARFLDSRTIAVAGADGDKSVAQQAAVGGEAGEPYDACYHRSCDTLANVDAAFATKLARAAATVVAEFAHDVSAVRRAG